MIRTDKIYDVGQLPEIGVVPRKMHAWTIRTDRLGNPLTAFRDEIVDLPELRSDEVLIANISVGINYNGIWAARGAPKNVIESNGKYGDPKEDFHICGSETAGIVYAVGENVRNVSVGDHVMISAARYDKSCPFILEGGEPEFSPTYHIWGYEANWGSFAQFSKVTDYQCLKKPDFFSWDEAAVCSATGTTASRMLRHWEGNRVKEGDVVLVWGGAGGLGTSVIQQAKAYGALPVAVVSSDERGAYCCSLGAVGYINRKKYTHWGNISELDEEGYKKWLLGATMFRNEIYSIIGSRKNPSIVVEHPGSDTLSTSLFVTANGGMVVLCGATTGYIASVDLRHLWIYQKRIQGSHAGSAEDMREYLRLCEKCGIKPSVCRIYPWNELPKAHADMAEGADLMGKYAVRIVTDIEGDR
ncbi:MAG: crotonyl-CoA carboxylase/reductase [Ruminococcus sp.]|nr:crotonyl-CoA carboxylase/reductase [Ruminococcus sp.]